MPTYEYRCSICSREFEVQQSIKDKPLTKRPGCKRKTKSNRRACSLEKLLSLSSVKFEGDGWTPKHYE
jgi:putative FmdB family regulatory protein